MTIEIKKILETTEILSNILTEVISNTTFVDINYGSNIEYMCKDLAYSVYSLNVFIDELKRQHHIEEEDLGKIREEFKKLEKLPSRLLKRCEGY